MTATTIPTSAAELEEMLNDQAKMKNVWSEGKFGEFIKNYAQVQNDKNTEISAQVREETQRVLAEFVKEQRQKGATTPVNLSYEDRARAAVTGKLYNAAAPGAPLDKEFRDLTEFFTTIAPHNRNNPKYTDKLRVLNTYGSVVPSDGGFLLPETFRAEILQTVLESGIVRPRAFVVPMDAPAVSIPCVDESTHATSVFGGVVTYWTSEASQLQGTSAKFGRVKLDTTGQSLTAYAEAPNELVTDAPMAFSAWIQQAMPKAIAFEEDYKFMQGNGVGEPLGYLKGSGVVTVTKENNQVADTINIYNINKMFCRMLPASLTNAVWVAAIDTFTELASMALPVGLGGSGPIWLNNGIAGAPPMTIYGRPVLFTEKCPKLGDAGDISFVDLSYYLLGDRQTVTVDASTEYKFGYNMTAFRAVERVDGRPWLQSAITPKNASTNTLSAYVALGERA